MLIHEFLEKSAKRLPEKIALIFNKDKFNYKQINEKANQLANTIRSKGITADSVVGLMTDRSVEMILD